MVTTASSITCAVARYAGKSRRAAHHRELVDADVGRVAGQARQIVVDADRALRSRLRGRPVAEQRRQRRRDEQTSRSAAWLASGGPILSGSSVRSIDEFSAVLLLRIGSPSVARRTQRGCGSVRETRGGEIAISTWAVLFALRRRAISAQDRPMDWVTARGVRELRKIRDQSAGHRSRSRDYAADIRNRGFGSTVTQLNLGRFGLASSGNLAFYYELANGRKGIAVPEPSRLAMLIAGGALLFCCARVSRPRT